MIRYGFNPSIRRYRWLIYLNETAASSRERLQHYDSGDGTRLLDMTTSPLAALLFSGGRDSGRRHRMVAFTIFGLFARRSGKLPRICCQWDLARRTQFAASRASEMNKPCGTNWGFQRGDRWAFVQLDVSEIVRPLSATSGHVRPLPAHWSSRKRDRRKSGRKLEI